jgi:hypothetical protein
LQCAAQTQQTGRGDPRLRQGDPNQPGLGASVQIPRSRQPVLPPLPAFEIAPLFSLLGRWLNAQSDLAMACKLDYDDVANEWLKEVQPNVSAFICANARCRKENAD